MKKIKIKNVGRSIKKAFTSGRVRKVVGSIAQQAKKYVPKELIKGVVAAGAAGASALTANPMVGRAILKAGSPFVDAVYETNLAKGSVGKNLGKNYAKQVAEDALNAGLSSVVGMGIDRPVPKARLRKILKGSIRAGNDNPILKRVLRRIGR